MRQINNEYYGDATRWFFATVIDGTPPLGLEGRVKIRIHGLHSDNVNDIPQADLPWAQVIIPGTFGGSSGFSPVPQLLPGALVFGFFLDGKASQLPIILGSTIKREYPSTIQAEGRDDPTVNPFTYDIYNNNNLNVVASEYVDINTRSLEQKRSITMKFFIDNGFSPIQSAGIVGVLSNIGFLDATKNDGTIAGLAGWEVRSDRWKKYLDFNSRFFSQVGKLDYGTQLIYILMELRSAKSLAAAKLFKTNQIIDTFTGVRVDGRITGLGSANVFRTFYLSKLSLTYTTKETSEFHASLAYESI